MIEKSKQVQKYQRRPNVIIIVCIWVLYWRNDDQMIK